MISHKKLNMSVNVEPLKKALDENISLFGKYNYRGAEGGPHVEMKDIWVRYNDINPYLESGDFSTFADEHDSIWYDVINVLPVKEIAFKIMEHVDGERLGGILITKLPPGGKIKRHIDGGWHAAYYDKYYVPVKDYGSTFNFTDGALLAGEGNVYWFDNSIEHWVENDTDMDRIAMIICIKTDNRIGE